MSSGEGVGNVSLHGLLFRADEIVQLTRRQGGAWQQVDGAVVWLVGWQ